MLRLVLIMMLFYINLYLAFHDHVIFMTKYVELHFRLHETYYVNLNDMMMSSLLYEFVYACMIVNTRGLCLISVKP